MARGRTSGRWTDQVYQQEGSRVLETAYQQISVSNHYGQGREETAH